MHIERKLLRKLFVFAAGILVFAWLLLDTARAGILFSRVWELLSPFVIGTGIAFVFNVPMRALEKQLVHIKRPGLRRGAAILLTLLNTEMTEKNEFSIFNFPFSITS